MTSRNIEYPGRDVSETPMAVVYEVLRHLASIEVTHLHITDEIEVCKCR